MTKVMIHRPLPTVEGRLVREGIYGMQSRAGGFSLYTLGQPNILLCRMTYEMVNKADLEGWLTKLAEPGTVDQITVSHTGITAYDQAGRVIGWRAYA